MSSRRKIEDRIHKKKEEIQELESKTREAKSYIQALQDVLKLLPRDESGIAETVLRSGSAASGTREAILKAGRPLHITELLAALGRENTREARSSLSGSLAAYVRKDEVFTRPRPNTFGLIEMPVEIEPPDAPPDEPPDEPVDEPPDTFGSPDIDQNETDDAHSN